MADLVHVISKRSNATHAVCPLNPGPEPTQPLAAASVRARTSLISLTSNNLTYARLGGPLHWWDAYPPPGSLPEPYNNAEEWGIVPAWGYGVVTESTIDALRPGSLLWGFWPTSSHPVDLQLRPSAPDGYWTESSLARSKLMSIYNLYQEAAAESAEIMAMKALYKPVWRTGYLLNHAVFSSPPFHPMGLNGPWTEEDADLSSAVVISLSASSKTGRNFAWGLARDRDTEKVGPLALLQLTSMPELLATFAESTLPVKAAKYDETSSALEWVSSFQPSRVVIIDFGAPGAVLDSVLGAVSDITEARTIIAVGSEARVVSGAELQAGMAKARALGKVQMNTSDLRDRVLEVEAPADFFGKVDETWDKCYRENGFGKLKLKSLRGVQGPEGIEGAWDDLCQRRISPDASLVVYLSGPEDVVGVAPM